MKFDVSRFLELRGIPQHAPQPHAKNGTKIRLKKCPFCGDHQGAWVSWGGTYPEGHDLAGKRRGNTFSCSHNSCKGEYNWDAMREKLGPPTMAEVRECGEMPSNRSNSDARWDAPRVAPYSPDFVTASELSEETDQITYLVDECVVAGQNLIVGGPSKSLKTSISADLAVSLASGTDFLGTFPVDDPRPVGFISGESGRQTIRDTIIAIANSKGILAPAELHVSFQLPCLSEVEHLATIEDIIAERELSLLIIDPAYLALMSAGSKTDASSVFQMGPLLKRYADIGESTGCSMCLVHHTKKGVRPGTLPDMGDLSQAGFGEFARQWILINRKSPFVPYEQHDLLMSIGGSAGHAGEYVAHITDSMQYVGRIWEVEINDRHSEAEREKEKQQRIDKVMFALKSMKLPEVPYNIGRAVKGIPGKQVQNMLPGMAADGLIERCKVQRDRSSPDGYRLPPPEKQFEEVPETSVLPGEV